MDEDGELLSAGIMDHPPKLLLVWKPLQTYEYEERLKLGNQWTLAFTWVCEVDLIHAFMHAFSHSLTHSFIQSKLPWWIQRNTCGNEKPSFKPFISLVRDDYWNLRPPGISLRNDGWLGISMGNFTSHHWIMMGIIVKIHLGKPTNHCNGFSTTNLTPLGWTSTGGTWKSKCAPTAYDWWANYDYRESTSLR